MKQIDGKEVYSVSEINYFAKQSLEQLEVWVTGEVSQIQQNDNWYYSYIRIIDESSVLPAICTKEILSQLDQLQLGQKVLIYGFPTLFDSKGQYKFKILRIEAAGEGLLQKQLEALIKKLKGEGLFDEQYKKEIPLYPKKICVVTSYRSDAWNDFKRHTIDKFPIIELFTSDVRVQGEKSVPQLLKILPKIDKKGFDVLIITRGGGSLEDLAAFNDERVARTIFGLKTPTVVAIGHEANESLAEWVADVRASTPTDAASIVMRGYNQVLERLYNYQNRLSQMAGFYFSTNQERLDNNYRQLSHMKYYFKDLPHKLETIKNTLKHTQKYFITDSTQLLLDTIADIKRNFKVVYKNQAQNLSQLEKALLLLSPQNTLNRGYAIATDRWGRILRSVVNVVAGDMVGVKLKDGKLQTQVKSKLNG